MFYSDDVLRTSTSMSSMSKTLSSRVSMKESVWLPMAQSSWWAKSVTQAIRLQITWTACWFSGHVSNLDAKSNQIRFSSIQYFHQPLLVCLLEVFEILLIHLFNLINFGTLRQEVAVREFCAGGVVPTGRSDRACGKLPQHPARKQSYHLDLDDFSMTRCLSLTCWPGRSSHAHANNQMVHLIHPSISKSS